MRHANPRWYGPIVETGPHPRKRCKRYNIPGHAHELTFSCHRRQPFLLKERVRLWLAETVIDALEKHSIDLCAWAFMPERVHLLAWPRSEEYSVSSFLDTLKRPVTRKAIRHLKANAPEGLKYLATGMKSRPRSFWQRGGGYDRNLVGRPALLKAIDYIHNNPVCCGLASSPSEWEWSSARQWDGGGIRTAARQL